ncbi:hypothetical protein P8452_34556 [Trifolium repens]|nr:hypothetical protein P8452_34556 [Trifolium repens]
MGGKGTRAFTCKYSNDAVLCKIYVVDSCSYKCYIIWPQLGIQVWIVSEENCSSIQDAKDGILDLNKTAESEEELVERAIKLRAELENAASDDSIERAIALP